MGVGILGFFLVVAVCFRPLVCQQPNTDGFFVSNFLQNMGLKSSKVHNFSAHFCSWQGVFCDSKEERVVRLVATGLGLSGVVSENTIGKLTMLEILDLSNNNLTGLPSDIWSLGSLKFLNLSFNQLSGVLSSNIGNFAKLQSLDLSHNNFSGSLPEAMSSLLSLQLLNLSRNGFDSKVPSGIMNCHSLVSLDLSGNKLGDSLHDGFGAAFPKLQFLNLAENEIHGKDSVLSGMVSLTYLNVSGNLFKGSVVGVFGGPLEVVDLSRNQFQGHVSQVNLGSNFSWSNLVYIDLSENQLSGEIFMELNSAQNLKHLNLAYNRFSHQRFPRIGMVRDLEYLNLSSTNLIGEIPSDLSLLSSLKTLDISRNHLSSHIPMLNTKKLRILDVSYNNLSGEIPLSLVEILPSMIRFNFSYNNVTFCSSQIPPATLQSAFIGSSDGCPIAANPSLFKGKASKHRGLKLVLALTFSLTFSIVVILLGLLFLAFGCRRKPTKWAVKQSSYKEEQSVSGPFSFRTDSTTWVADVKQANSVPVVIFEKPLLNLTFSDLLSATSNFDQGTLLAEGRFGPVYRGYLPGGIHVAVKVLVHGSTMNNQEAARELEYLGRIKHPNLVPLTGYCLAGEQRIAIYDYMENGNLHNLLHDLPLGVQTTEDWSTDTWELQDDSNGIQNVGSEGLLTTWLFRHKIALGTARALAFLHHGCSPPIIHRDVKASSVYLDCSLEPRLSDFGLAKIFGNGLEDEIARGSPGYIPPEFLQPETSSPKTPTPKSDVFGFGVILFELLTGKKPVGDDYPEEKDGNLVIWVRGLVRKNQGLRAIDPKIHGTAPETQMEEALKIGYLCTADSPSKRPSMQQVVGLLKDIESITKQ
nr:probable LRR receptor-like serine/threonine-protein kinase At2g24230 [Ipomoea batatas]